MAIDSISENLVNLSSFKIILFDVGKFSTISGSKPISIKSDLVLKTLCATKFAVSIDLAVLCIKNS